MDLQLDGRMIIEALAFLAFTGWNLYLTSLNAAREADKIALQKELDELKVWRDSFEKETGARWERVLVDFVTKGEAALVRAEMLNGIERLEKKLDRALEIQIKLWNERNGKDEQHN